MRRTQLAQKLTLSPTKEKLASTSFVVGFDGFIDEIITVVRSRLSHISFEPIVSIPELSERLLQARDKSMNLELVVTQVKIGGNGPILAEALTACGIAPTLIGALGLPKYDPLFMPLIKKCKRVISIANPGHTDALEFSDGKILLGKHHSILSIDDHFFRNIPQDTMTAIFDEVDIFASVNWTMILKMTDIWKYLTANIFPYLSPKKRILFIDLADPAKRSDNDLLAAFEALIQMKSFFTVILGLNLAEAERIGALYQILRYEDTTQDEEERLSFLARSIQEKTALSEVVIHATKCAVHAAESGGEVAIKGPYTAHPYLTTGGGDNFNAGFLIGAALDLSPTDCLLMGTACSGFYVRNGKSPTLEELIGFLRAWDRNALSP